MTWQYWMDRALKVLGAIVNLVTPEVKDLVHQLIQEGYAKAKMTENPWDDFLFKVLATLLGVELEE